MINKIKTRDIVSTLIDEASKRFEPKWITTKMNKEAILEYCDMFDELCVDIEEGSITVSVDDITKRIEIDLRTYSYTFTGIETPFNWLAIRSKEFGFRYVSEDEIDIMFIFPSIWADIEYI